MKTLYLGIDPPANSSYIHYPIIKTLFRKISPLSVQALAECSHLIFTSKNGIRAIADHINVCLQKPVFAVGKQTEHLLVQYGFEKIQTANEETAEGLVSLLGEQTFQDPYFVWPHSALSRTIIPDFFLQQNFRFHEFIAYDTQANVQLPLPNLAHFEEIVFTSPSTVSVFLEHFGQPPEHLKLTAIGPVTQQSILLNFLK